MHPMDKYNISFALWGIVRQLSNVDVCLLYTESGRSGETPLLQL